MSLRETKRAATERRILSCARQLFLARGYASTSMSEIAAEAAVSRATLFNYFRGKSALLEAIAGEFEARLAQTVAHYRRREPSAPLALEALFARAAVVLEQTADLTRLLVTESAGSLGFPALEAAFVELVRYGQAREQWRSDIAAEQLAEPLYLGFLASLLYWCRRPQLELAEEFATRAAALNRLLA